MTFLPNGKIRCEIDGCGVEFVNGVMGDKGQRGNFCSKHLKDQHHWSDEMREFVRSKMRDTVGRRTG